MRPQIDERLAAAALTLCLLGCLDPACHLHAASVPASLIGREGAAYVANFGDNTVSVISRDTLTTLTNVSVGSGPWKLASSPDGRWVFVANSHSASVSVIDTVTGHVGPAIPVGNEPSGLAVSPDSQRLYVLNSASASMSVVDIATSDVITTVPTASTPSAIAYHPQRAELWIGYNAGGGRVVDVRSAADYSVLGSLNSSSRLYASSGLVFAPDGSSAWGTESCGCCGRFHRISGTIAGGTLSILESDVLFNNQGSANAAAVGPISGLTYLAKAANCGGTPSIYEIPSGRRLLLPAAPSFVAVEEGRARLWVPLSNGSVTLGDIATMTSTGTVSVGANPQVVVLAPFGRPRADLGIDGALTPNAATVGEDLTITLTITNAGPGSATQVHLTNALPASLSFLSAVSSQGGCTHASGEIACDLGTLDPGTTATVTILARAVCAGQVTNLASVTSNELDPHPANNQSTLPVVIDPGSADTVGVSLSLEFCLTWPDVACASNLILEQADSATGSWRPVAAEQAIIGGKRAVILPNAAQLRVFRLRQP